MLNLRCDVHMKSYSYFEKQIKQHYSPSFIVSYDHWFCISISFHMHLLNQLCPYCFNLISDRTFNFFYNFLDFDTFYTLVWNHSQVLLYTRLDRLHTSANLLSVINKLLLFYCL